MARRSTRASDLHASLSMPRDARNVADRQAIPIRRLSLTRSTLLPSRPTSVHRVLLVDSPTHSSRKLKRIFHARVVDAVRFTAPAASRGIYSYLGYVLIRASVIAIPSLADELSRWLLLGVAALRLNWSCFTFEKPTCARRLDDEISKSRRNITEYL